MPTLHLRVALPSLLFSAALAVAVVVTGSASAAAPADQAPKAIFSSPLISASELHTLLLPSRRSPTAPAVTVLDTRELLQADNKTPNFEAGHIPGALPLPYSLLRGPKDNPGRPPELAQLQALLQPLGLNLHTPIVLTGSGSDPTEFGAVARSYWTLKSVGFTRLAILNGGFGAWLASKYPVEKGSARTVTANKALQLTPHASLRLSVSTQTVNELRLASEPALFVDARPEDFFMGQLRHSAAARWGTLPNAQHFDSEEWFTPNTGRLPGLKELRAIAQAEGFLQKKPQVAFCNTGHWAATHWFIVSELLGQDQVRLYPESTIAWSQAGLPMDNEPSRAVALLRQAQGKGVQ
ncbi:MAG: sulfurtransferase [Burkholderiaceae bacterium]|jgi:thiosulfate/3-mercaptopyruvate sulfurtransferase